MRYIFVKAKAIWQYGGKSRHPLIKDIYPGLQNNVMRRICYSRPHNFTYVRIPKVANSTICKTLLNYMPEKRQFEDDPTGSKSKRELRDLPRLEQFHESFSFAFTREPASRVLSAWMDKTRNPSFQGKFEFTEPGTDNELISFRSFLELLDRDLLMKNPHWSPQAQILPFKGKGYSCLAKFENLNADLEMIVGEIFGQKLQIDSKQVEQTGASSKVAEYVGDYERKLIQKMYEEDYDLFYSDGQI